jgi:hypothetical protein
MVSGSLNLFKSDESCMYFFFKSAQKYVIDTLLENVGFIYLKKDKNLFFC